jgi:hypothetical protein
MFVVRHLAGVDPGPEGAEHPHDPAVLLRRHGARQQLVPGLALLGRQQLRDSSLLQARHRRPHPATDFHLRRPGSPGFCSLHLSLLRIFATGDIILFIGVRLYSTVTSLVKLLCTFGFYSCKFFCLVWKF